jgi:hypothetical protein
MFGPLLSVTRREVRRSVVTSWLVLGLCLALWLGLCGPSTRAHAQVGGVAFDSRGEVRLAEPLSETERQALREALPQPPAETAHTSALRVVSLRRLEAALERQGEAGKSLDCDQLPGELRFLAGLHRVDWVLCPPEAHDIWLVGPGGGWKADDTGRPVAVSGGRPVLELDDLLVALRYAFPQQETDDFIGCSIDPTPAGLAAVERLLQQHRRIDATRAGPLARALEQAAGPQAITLFGIPPDSRFAHKLVSADYRLKRLALGHDPAPVPGWKSSPDLLAQRGAVGRVPQQRWWFAPAPGALRVLDDRTAWRIDPQPLQVQTARRGADGEPATPATREATQFAELATRLLPDVVARVPIFAELQNLLALSLAAEIVRNRAEAADAAADNPTDLVATPSWRPGLLLDATRLLTWRGPIPRQIAPLAQVRPGGKGAWICTVSGGVDLRPDDLVRQAGALGQNSPLPRLTTVPTDPTRWWWDATPAETDAR